MITTRLFLDTEFTGLHQGSTLISLGIIAESGEEFYAEFTDYDTHQLNPWLEENVMKNLTMLDKESGYQELKNEKTWRVKGDRLHITQNLRNFLHSFDKIEFWVDYVAYDWVLFCELFGGSMGLPKNVYYIPFDMPTYLRAHGEDPDINREKFVQDYIRKEDGIRHNALWDAKLLRYAYQKLTKE